MSMGMGAMIHTLGGGSPKNAEDYYGRKIKSVKLKDNKILIKFSDGVNIKIWDDGQSCCESRYMTTDDSLSSLAGDKLVSILVKDGPSEEVDYNHHDIQFLEIQTDKGFVTVSTHVEHNGYYGGFGLSLDEV